MGAAGHFVENSFDDKKAGSSIHRRPTVCQNLQAPLVAPVVQYLGKRVEIAPGRNFLEEIAGLNHTASCVISKR